MAHTEWYRQSLCKIHLDMHCPEWHPSILKNMDPEQIVRRVAATGADSLYFFAKDHYGNAYYDTKIGHKNRCIGDRDLLEEVVRAGKKANLRIVAYYSVVWDIHAGRAHPEWLQRDAQGRTFPELSSPSAFSKWLTLCHNTGYVDYAKSMLEEIAANYDVDGFHLDMFHLDFGNVACCCDACRARFRAETGKEIPNEPAWDATWRRFLEFRYASVDRCMHTLVDAVHDARPGLFATTNYHGSPGFDWRAGQRPVQHSRAGSMSTGETYTPAFGDMYPGMEVRFLRGLEPGKPIELVCWRMNRITDFTNKPLPQFRWEAFTALANGASVMVIDQPFHDGQLDPVAYDRMAQVFREAASKRFSFAGEPLKHVALYYSAKTRDWYGRDAVERFHKPVAGAYKALSESHVFVDFLFDETAAAQSLAAFPVVFLPNVAVLEPAECALFEDYVRNGGTLIATKDTSLYDEDGNRLPNFRLAELFGVDYGSTTESLWHFWRDFEGVFGADIDSRYAILNDGQAHRVKPTTADGHGQLLDAFFKPEPPDQFFSHAVHPPFAVIGHALFVNAYGKGRVFYLPHGCDSAYADQHELPEHRLLLRNIVAAAGYTAPVQVVRAPLNVEVAVNSTGGQYFIHLLSFNPTRQSCAGFDNPVRPSIRMDEPALYRAVLDVRGVIANVTAFSETTQIAVEGNRIEVTCEDVHEVITVTLKM